MDPQLQDLAREISEAVAQRLRGEFGESEARVKKHIDEFETRVELRLQMHFESMGEKVKRAAEGYGGTLESIDRRLDRLEKEWKRIDIPPYFIARRSSVERSRT